MTFFRLFIFSLAFMALAFLFTADQASQAQSALVVEISPRELPQGRTAIVRVFADASVERVEAVFLGRQTPFYLSNDGAWVGFMAAHLDGERGDFPLQILTWQNGQVNPPYTDSITVVWGSFLYQDIVIPNAQLDLLNPELNTREEETVLRVYERLTREKLWEGALQVPVAGAQISEFGGIRTYNGGLLESRHTGTDFRAGTGEPALAAGHGRVVFAQFLPIRGNHVIIDHGLGVLTGYSHLNEIYVVPGQRVLAGDIIGTVGATGRVQGAHMHFEVAVHGSWVDPLQFLSLNPPDEAALRAEG